jgi:hypothetical protein
MSPVRVEAPVLATTAGGWSFAALAAATALLLAGGWVLFLGNRELR